MKVLAWTGYRNVPHSIWKLCQSSTVNLCPTLTCTCLSRSYSSHHDTLGVKSNASQEDIKKAFVKLCKKYHPDINRDDPESHKKFVAINEAYTALMKQHKDGRNRSSFGNRQDPLYNHWTQEDFPKQQKHAEYYKRDARNKTYKNRWQGKEGRQSEEEFYREFYQQYMDDYIHGRRRHRMHREENVKNPEMPYNSTLHGLVFCFMIMGVGVMLNVLSYQRHARNRERFKTEDIPQMSRIQAGLFEYSQNTYDRREQRALAQKAVKNSPETPSHKAEDNREEMLTDAAVEIGDK